MEISFRIDREYLTVSGKPKIYFKCKHCCYWLGNLDSYFYATNLDKNNLESSLSIFVEAISDKTIENLFPKKVTAQKLYRHLCNCNPKIINIKDFKEHQEAKERAKNILQRGLEIINERRK